MATKNNDAILDGLNAEQKEAVIHKEGPLLIIAGAGTGKTTVISRRICWLVMTGLAKMDEILALTFTDKAAEEMTERVDILLPYGYTDVWISTFHAFGDRIIRENALEVGLNPDFEVMIRPEAAIFFREHLFEFPLRIFRPLSNPTKFIDAILELFSRLRDEDISPKEYLEFAWSLNEKVKDSTEAEKEEAAKHLEIAQCYEKYLELLDKEGRVDFGNQFYLALEILRRHPSILKKYQLQFKYILVDEFQDTNYVQFQLIKLLGEKIKNITVVADDDQSIYRFRGAAYSNILNFMNSYPEAKKISLINNYRSTQVILDTAYRLIQHNNPERFEVKAAINKQLIGICPDGKEVKHLHFDTVSSEADAVAQIIEDKVKNNEYKYGDFAILVRSNNDADPFLRSLNMKNIPWRFSGNKGLYSRPEVRMCINFLRVLGNLMDSPSLFYLASSEIYKIPVEDLTYCMHFAKRSNRSLFYVLKHLFEIVELSDLLNEKSQAKIAKLVKDITEYVEFSAGNSTGRLLYKFLTDTNYLKDLVKHSSLENEEKIKNIAKFFELIRNFESVAKEDRLVNFINHLEMLIESGDDPAMAEAEIDEDAVNVLTVHKAKGLEFTVVFLVSLVKGKFPWPRRGQKIIFPEELIKDIKPEGDFHMQEERRLFYVGMTRAKKELYLTSASDYGTKQERKISPFVIEALGINPEKISVIKTTPIELIRQHAGIEQARKRNKKKISKKDILDLSAYKIDDYLTCPLKYSYIHQLGIPIMEHHTVVYGSAIHKTIERYYQYRMNKKSVTKDELLEWFQGDLRREGFFSSQHYQERLEHGRLVLAQFYEREEKTKTLPFAIEQEFQFMIGNNRIKGRFDRIDKEEGKSIIVDFKSSSIENQKEADKKAKENLQLSLYAYAYCQINKELPKQVKLYFIESGIIGVAEKDDDDFEQLLETIDIVSEGIRAQNFQPKPSYNACSVCAFSQICPYTTYE